MEYAGLVFICISCMGPRNNGSDFDLVKADVQSETKNQLRRIGGSNAMHEYLGSRSMQNRKMVNGTG